MPHYEQYPTSPDLDALLAVSPIGYDYLVALTRAAYTSPSPAQAIHKRALELSPKDPAASLALDAIATTFDFDVLDVEANNKARASADHVRGMQDSFAEASEAFASAFETTAQHWARTFAGATSPEVTKMVNDMPPASGDV